MALPPHETKHLATLSYPFLNHTFELSQLDNGEANGTALWLGGCILSVFLADVLPSQPSQPFAKADLSTRTVGITCCFSECYNRASDNFDLTVFEYILPRLIDEPNQTRYKDRSLALSTLGWDVIATDIPQVVGTVLRPNIERNTCLHESLPRYENFGTVEVRELDWTVEPSVWSWDDPVRIATQQHQEDRPICPGSNSETKPEQPDSASFDLIITSDTLYSTALVAPLLRTLHHLCLISQHQPEVKERRGSPLITPKPSRNHKQPIVYLALENRDPGLVSLFLTQAKDGWGFTLSRIPQKRITRSMKRGKLDWEKNEWEGVEIWKMQIGTGEVTGK